MPIIHELAIQESKDLDFFHCQQKDLLDHLSSLHYFSIRRSSLQALSNNCWTRFHESTKKFSSLRTLLGFNLKNDQEDLNGTPFPTCNMKLIRVIDLEGVQIEEVPDAVGDLAYLRYLGLKDTPIEELPLSVT